MLKKNHLLLAIMLLVTWTSNALALEALGIRPLVKKMELTQTTKGNAVANTMDIIGIQPETATMEEKAAATSKYDEGVSAYNKNCSSCHGSFDLYAKGRTTITESKIFSSHKGHDDANLAKFIAEQKTALKKKHKDGEKYPEVTYIADAMRAKAKTFTYEQLKPLRVGSSLLINTNSTSSNVAPTIQAIGVVDSFDWKGGEMTSTINFQFKPDPASGTTEQISKTILTDPGTFALNYSWQYAQIDQTDGPYGYDVNLGGNLTYQRSPVATDATASTTTTNSVHEFGTYSGDVRLGVWLKYLYAGYKYTRNMTFGGKNEISDSVNNANIHKLVLITKIESLSGPITEKQSVDAISASQTNPFYVEIQYTGGKNSFNNGTFTIAVTKAFDWLK